MPLQFKLYYACAMYLLLWGSSFLLWMFYQSAVHGMGSGTGIILTAFLIMILVIITGFMGVRAVKHFKEALLLSKTGRAIFIATYCFIVLFAMGISLLLGIVIIPEEFRRRDYTGYIGRMNTEDLVLSGGLFFAAIAAIYVSITGLMLQKAIRFKHRDNLLSFEIETNHIN